MEKGNQLITADASVIERLAIFSESEILKLANLITKPEVKIAVIDGVIRKYHPNTSVFAVFRFDAPELRNILFVHYIQKLLEEGDTKAFSDDWFFYCFKEFMKSTSVKSVNENTITTMKKLVELSARFIKSKEKSKEFNELLESFLSSDSKSENVSNDKSIVVTSQALVDSVKHSFRLTKSSSAVAVLRYLEQQRDARADISPNEWSAVSEIVSKWISDIVWWKQLYNDKLRVFHELTDSMDDRKCADFLMANRYYDSDREYRIFSNHEVFASVIELRYGQGYMENVDVLEKLVSIDSANVELMLKLLGKYLKNNRYEAIKNAPNKLTGFYKKNPKEYLTLTGFDERSASFSQYVRANKKNVFELGSECVNKEFFDAYMGFVKENGLLKKYVVDGDSAIPFGIRTLLNKDFTMYISKFVVDTARRDGVMLKAAVRLARVYMNQGFVMCPDSDFEKLIADALSEAVPTGDSDLDALKQTVKNNNQYFESKYGKDKTPVIAAFRSLVIRALDATDKGKVLNSFGFNDEGKWSFLFT